MKRRLGAIAAILGGAAALLVGVIGFITNFPGGLVVLACILGALGAAWLGLLRHGLPRLLGMVVAALLLGLAIGVLLAADGVLELILVATAFGISVTGTRVAFRTRRSLPPAPPPSHPVLFVNPRSGDGRAEQVGLLSEAGERGIEAIELKPGDDLEQLARGAIARGANGLAMAGGDGSQALVAAIAAEHDLPYACIPAGTRNHFALDLGVDRDDVIGALDAFVEGGERLVDLGEVNGLVFVNNVSLGAYAEAVGQEGYREAKLHTLLETIPDILGPEGSAPKLRWRDPDGVERRSTAMVLVSNNAYRLGPRIGSGTRPQLDEGVLGVVDFRPPAGGDGSSEPIWRELKMRELEIDADGPIPIGIDGESVILEPPLRFRSRPGALRARIASSHPGASPSADLPQGLLPALMSLARTAVQR